MKIPMIYLDMDGVIADLDAGVIEFTGDENAMGDKRKLFMEYLPEYVAHQGFITSPVMENAVELVNGLCDMMDKGLIRLSILTSAGQFVSPNHAVVNQKKVYLEKYFPRLDEVPFCVTSSGADKAYFANQFALLIDDHAKNIMRFREAGGRGVVYTPDICNDVIDVVSGFALQVRSGEIN